MLQHCQDPARAWLAPIILCAAATGMRPNELTALRWTNLDFEQGLIRIDGPQARPWLPRSVGARTIPLPPILAEALKKLPRHPDGLVFHDPRLRPVVSHRLVRSLRREVLIPLVDEQLRHNSTGLRGGDLHGFRHAFIIAASGQSLI